MELGGVGGREGGALTGTERQGGHGELEPGPFGDGPPSGSVQISSMLNPFLLLYSYEYYIILIITKCVIFKSNF